MRCHTLKQILATSLITVGAALNLFAQSQPAATSQSNTQAPAKPCSSKPENRQFDFWIGEWDVEVGGRQAGTNSVQLILGDCVIFENWTGARGMTGKSFNIYNSARGKWQQTWVDSTGSVLELYGEFKDGAMRLVGEQRGPNGGKVINKLTFFPLEGARVRQLWESSQDDGKTWSTVFDGLYIRKKSAAVEKDGRSISTSDAQEKLKAAMKRYDQLTLAMNAESIAAMYTQDGALSNDGQTIASTPASIRAFLGSFEGKVRVIETGSSIESVNITGASAIMSGAFQQKALILSENREIQVKGKFDAEWIREPGGQWLIRRMNTQSTP